ncbi:MAG: hypothetical protein NXI18_10915 [Alphaproteobacteria bacterium]|nr:hypothetical protein [Alphaproteobacteria bacterium]
MKRLLLTAAALIVLLAGGNGVIAAGEREAVVRALEELADRFQASDRDLRWGGIETGGGVFTTDISISDLAVTHRTLPLAVRIDGIDLTDVSLDDTGRIERIEVLRITGTQIDGMDLSGLLQKALGIFPKAATAIEATVVCDMRVEEIELEQVDGPTFQRMIDELSVDPARLQIFPGAGKSPLRARGVSVNDVFTVTVESRESPLKKTSTVTAKTSTWADEMSVGPAQQAGFYEIEARGMDGRTETRSDELPGKVEQQITQIGSFRFTIVDFSDPAFLAKSDILEMAFFPLVHEVEMRDFVQTGDWFDFTSEHQWVRYEAKPEGGGRYRFGSDRSTLTPTDANPLRPFFESQFSPEGGLLSATTGTLDFEPTRRVLALEMRQAFDQLIDLSGNVSLSRIPKVALSDLSPENDSPKQQPPVVLDDWGLMVTDLGFRQVAFESLAALSEEKKTAADIKLDFLTILYSKSQTIDPLRAPLTALALQAVRSFVNDGGSLKAASDQTQKIDADTPGDLLTLSQPAAIDRFQILVDHIPPR